MENGHNVAVLEYHDDDSLENQYSLARNSYYNITAFPTAYFDGVLEVIGGYSNQSMYPEYMPVVEQRNAIPSDFTIDIAFTHTGNDYTATITVVNVGGNTGTNLVLQVGITESNLPIVWGMGENVDFVTRLMVPDQNGTPLDFSGGITQVITLNFTLEEYWDEDNCEIVAFVQNNSGKEILQGTKRFLAVPLYNLDAQAKKVVYPTDEFCGSSMQPVVLIKNMGGENLTSLDIGYSVNGGQVETYAWTGNLAFNLGEEVELPVMNFSPQPVNTFEFDVSNPNGQPDQNPGNNTISAQFELVPQLPSGTVNFELKTDNFPSETTWELKNSAGATLYSGGPYSNPNTIYTEVFNLTAYDCYTYTIYDTYGDGICCTYGNGYYKLMDENNTVFMEGGEFGNEESKGFQKSDPNAVMADFTADANNIPEGSSISYIDLSVGTINAWAWTFEGGIPANSSEQNPSVTYDVPGIYDVTLTVSNSTNSNTMTKTDYITVNSTTGVFSDDNEGVRIYPNPSHGLLYIQGAKGADLTVYNSMGIQVMKIACFDGDFINLSGYAEGVYNIRIWFEDNKELCQKVTIGR